MHEYNDTEYELDVYGWNTTTQERYFIKTITNFEDLKILDFADQIDEVSFTVAQSVWTSDVQSVRVIEKQSGTDIYRGKIVDETKSGTNLDVETKGTFTGASGVVGDVEYSLYVGSTSEAAPEFEEKITNFQDLSINKTAGAMSDWSATVPPQPRLEQYGFKRVTIWDEDAGEAFFVGVLEEINTEPTESTDIAGRGVFVEEDYNSTSVTYSDIAIVDAIEDFATNYLQFDWSFVGTRSNVTSTIDTSGKTFTGTHYEIFRDLHNLSSLSFNLVYNDWDDVDIQTFQIGEPSQNQQNITIKDYSRGYDYTDYANKITLVGRNGITATDENVAEQNDFNRVIHKTIRKPRLETQSEVDNAVEEALNKAVNNRNQSGEINVVPTQINVGFDYDFDVFQDFFLDGGYVTDGYAELIEQDSHIVPRSRHIPNYGTVAEPNDSMVELIVYPDIENLGTDDFVYVLSGYNAPDYLKIYGDGSVSVKTSAMDTEQRTQAGLVEHNTSTRISILTWNDIFAEDGTVHYGGIWINGGDENNPDLGFFDAGDRVFVDYDGSLDDTRVHTSVPMRIGTNHPINEFSDSLNFHYPIEGQQTTSQDLLDHHSTGNDGRLSGSAGTILEETPKGQALSFEDDTHGYSASSDTFATLDNNGFTFLAFVKVDSLGTGVDGGSDEFRTLYGNGITPENGVTSDLGHSFVLSDNSMEVYWQSDTQQSKDTASTLNTPTLGEWAQVGVQFNYSQQEVRFILNGEIVSTSTWTSPDGNYSNSSTFSIFDGSGIETLNTYTFLGDVGEVRLLDGDVTEDEISEVYRYQQNKSGFIGGIDDIRFWSDNEGYQNFDEISNGYHLVPSGEIQDEPIVSATGETPLQTILNASDREINSSWEGSVLITEILRGYVTMDSVIQPDFDFAHDAGPRVGDTEYYFDSYSVTVPQTNTRVEEAQYNLSMDGGNLALNLDISSRIDTIVASSKSEIEDTKQVL